MKTNEIILIIGGGRLGRRAALLLGKEPEKSSITVVDKNPVYDFPDHVTTIQAEGISWLADNLIRDTEISKIIPAIPLHVAAYWLQRRLARQQLGFEFHPIPVPLFDLLPNPFQVEDGSVAISYAAFICPSDCSEPAFNCTATGLPRGIPLSKFLENMSCNSYRKLVITSHQFAPGVGGFSPDDLWLLLDQAQRMPRVPLFIATSCKCHAIVSDLRPVKD